MHDIVDLHSIKETKLAEISQEIEKEKENMKNYGDKMNRFREEFLIELDTMEEEFVHIHNVFSTITNIEESLSMENTYAQMCSSQTTLRNKTSELANIFKRPFPIFRFKPHREDKCVGHSFENHHPQQCECPKGLG